MNERITSFLCHHLFHYAISLCAPREIPASTITLRGRTKIETDTLSGLACFVNLVFDLGSIHAKSVQIVIIIIQTHTRTYVMHVCTVYLRCVRQVFPTAPSLITLMRERERERGRRNTKPASPSHHHTIIIITTKTRTSPPKQKKQKNPFINQSITQSLAGFTIERVINCP